MRRSLLIVCSVAAAAACYNNNAVVAPPVTLPPPTNLVYELVPSGDPANPAGILLRWDPPNDSRVVTYNVYSRSVVGAAWGLRATTTSASFYDLGVPDLQYMVTSSDGVAVESVGSNVVTVDAANQLPAPQGLSSISLNTAVQLSWLPNARAGANAAIFSYYRVYSTSYDLDNNLCGAQWVLEGTTVSEDFIASGLPNGVPRCYAVSAVSFDGHESQWSTPRSDTPRFDARNVLISAFQQTAATSGFLFADATSHAMGEVTSGARVDIDFRIDRHGDGTMWVQPIRTGTTVLALGAVADLTSIDYAPVGGYGIIEVPAAIGSGYIFETVLTDGLHYGALRLTAVTANYVIADWAYQTDPGNPELRRVKP